MKKLLFTLMLSGLSSNIIFGMDKQIGMMDLPVEIVDKIMKEAGSGSDYLSKAKSVLSFALANKFNMASVIYWLSHPEIIGNDPQATLQNLVNSGELIGLTKEALELAGANLTQVRIEDPQTKLFELAKEGKMSSLVLELLIEAGVDVNAKDNYGYTALIWGSYYGHKEIVKLLIDHKADVNAKNDASVTALIWAAWKGHKEVVKLLIDHKADVNAKNNFGWTALMLAARNGYKEIVKLLIDNKADVSARTNGGRTALMWASDKGHKEIMKLLE